MKDQIMLTESTAAITLLAALGGFWNLTRILLVIPHQLLRIPLSVYRPAPVSLVRPDGGLLPAPAGMEGEVLE